MFYVVIYFSELMLWKIYIILSFFWKYMLVFSDVTIQAEVLKYNAIVMKM